MGRPLKQKFFDPNGQGFGGEGVASTSGNVAVTWANVGLGYFSANATVTFSAPQLPGGATATGSLYLHANGAIKAVGLTSAGSGYTTKPTLAFTGANTYPAAGTITGSGLTGTVTNVIATSAWIPATNGGSSAVVGDIVKQTGARSYKVTTAQGTGKCKLVTTTPTAGTMTITATDSQSSTYYVKKLEENLVTLVQNADGGTGFDYAEGTQAKWTLTGSASAPTASDIGTVVISSN